MRRSALAIWRLAATAGLHGPAGDEAYWDAAENEDCVAGRHSEAADPVLSKVWALPGFEFSLSCSSTGENLEGGLRFEQRRRKSSMSGARDRSRSVRGVAGATLAILQHRQTLPSSKVQKLLRSTQARLSQIKPETWLQPKILGEHKRGRWASRRRDQRFRCTRELKNRQEE